VARDITDPVSKKSVLEESLKGSQEFRLRPPGAGSDYVAFEHHTGVASINAGFSGGDGGGVYHSIYDTFTWYTKYSDTQFVYGRALSQLMGTAVIRLADAPVLPFEYSGFVKNVRGWAEDLPKMAKSGGANLDLNEIQSELERIDAASARYELALSTALKHTEARAPAEMGKWNEVIYRSERAMLNPKGLPGREWYKNEIFAPGLYTGYGAKTLPTVREAAEASRWDEANAQVKNVAQVLRAIEASISEAAKLLSGI
jgi:N-acetylated-alpha-linked acidic dipeptidase